MRELLLATSHGVSAGASTGRFVFAAASAIDVATMRRVPEADTVANETRVVIERLGRVLNEAGCSLQDLAKVTCFVSDEAFRMEFIFAYRDLLAPGPYPSRATFSIGLAGDCRVQIDAIAVRPRTA
jgi:2-iminobutanoate/2-iminopropanoate deaminase